MLQHNSIDYKESRICLWHTQGYLVGYVKISQEFVLYISEKINTDTLAYTRARTQVQFLFRIVFLQNMHDPSLHIALEYRVSFLGRCPLCLWKKWPPYCTLDSSSHNRWPRLLDDQDLHGGGGSKPTFSVPQLSQFFRIIKTLVTCMISRSCLRGVSCRDTCQIWTSFKESNKYLCKIEYTG